MKFPPSVLARYFAGVSTLFFISAPLSAQVQEVNDPQQALQAQATVHRSLAASLSAETGRVMFKTDFFADGRNPSTFIGVDEQTQDRLIRSTGELEIQSDRLNLKMEDLLFNTTTGQLIAKQDVEVETQGIEAWSDELVYATETQAITLTYLPNSFSTNSIRANKPAVLLDSPEKRMTFNRMDQFQVVPESVGKTIYVNGRDLIEITMDEKSAAEASSSISRLGTSLNITVSSREGQAASTTAQMLESGDVSNLRMVGSIRLLSNEFNIRADEMIYNAQNNTFEAIGNVYITQETFEADCGQMVYDLLTGKIRLSSNPYVMYLNEMDKVEMMDYDVIDIEPSSGNIPNVVHDSRGTTLITSRASSAQ
ncbi:MAG: hypothetical protein ACFCU1_05825 [Sumerlaeia bacterium]